MARAKRQMPAQQPATSKQNYRTPVEFLQAAAHKLGIDAFSIDVAADDENAICDLYYTEQENGLVRYWNAQHPQWETPISGIAWCNPEFGQIMEWVRKAYHESQLTGDEAPATSAVLVPAGVGSNWWKQWVHGKARVLLLNGRLCFIHDWKAQGFQSKPLYPKDCCLLIYGPGIIPAYEVWSWGEEVPDLAVSPVPEPDDLHDLLGEPGEVTEVGEGEV